MAEDARSNLPQPADEPADQTDESAGPDSERGRLEEAAGRLRQRVNRYAAQHLGDGLQGEEILDDVLQSAIAAASRNRIEKPEGYLFRGVVRRIWDLLSHQPAVDYAGSTPDLDALRGGKSAPSVHEIERTLLVKEIIALMDEETRELHFRRARGDPWSSIAGDLRISQAAAQERFRYGIEKVRRMVLGRGPAKGARRGQGGNRP